METNLKINALQSNLTLLRSAGHGLIISFQKKKKKKRDLCSAFTPSIRAAADQEIPNSICCFFHLVSFPFHVCLLESLCGLAAFLRAKKKKKKVTGQLADDEQR